jgi:hypothetical protein
VIRGAFDDRTPTVCMALSQDSRPNRRRALLAVTPFLLLGLADVLLLLFWGIEPLWAFAILPPILFCTVLAWIAFSTDFLEDRT